MSTVNTDKSPNVIAIESMIGANSIVTIESGSDYFLTRQLGYGFFGVTYEGRSLENSHVVAIKIQAIDRAQSEAEVFRKVQLVEKCPQIVDFYEFGKILQVKSALGQINLQPGIEYFHFQLPDDGQIPSDIRHAITLFQAGQIESWKTLEEHGVIIKKRKELACIVMEYVQGFPLTVKKSCEIGEAMRIIGGICRAIEHMHRWYFVHGDLKPENIMITHQGNVKILDFSTAKKEGDPNLVVATSFYSPIHQHQSGKVDSYSDLYAIASILYRLLTGHEPIAQYLYTYQEFIVSSKVHAGVKKYFEHIADVPKELRQPICVTISKEIATLNNPVSSENSLKSKMMALPSGDVSANTPVIEYIPIDVLPEITKKHPPSNVQELATMLQQGYVSFQRRHAQEVLVKSVETVTNIIIAVIGVLFVVALVFSAIQDLAKNSVRNLPPMTRISGVGVVQSTKPPGPKILVTIMPATQTIEALASVYAEAGRHFEAAYTYHNQGMNDPNQRPLLYQKALDEYSLALASYRTVLKNSNVFPVKTQKIIYMSAYATGWNMSLLYEDLGDVRKTLSQIEESLQYLKQGYELSADVEIDLPRLVGAYRRLGAIHAKSKDFDKSLAAYRESINYLSHRNLPAKDKLLLKTTIITDLEKILDEPSLTDIYRTQIQEILTSLRNSN